MRILVVEDKEMHCESARETLKGHEVTIIRSFDEAMDLMRKEFDAEKAKRLKAEAGLKISDGSSEAEKKAYYDALEEIKRKSFIPIPFDVVLTDMMMPMSQRTLAREAFHFGEQVPYGFVIALRAARLGAKFVAMVTDTNHHQGAMSAALDNLRDMLTVNGAKVIFAHAEFVEDVVGKEECYSCKDNPGVCSICNGTGVEEGQPCFRCQGNVGKCYNCGGTGQKNKAVYERKDWGQILKILIS